MSNELDRDGALERLLREREALSPATPGCIDAERLAAWADAGLPAGEADLVERHLADCARCQTMAAAFASADAAPNVAAGSPLPWRKRRVVYWVVPVAAAAAAGLLLWVAAPRDAGPAVPVQQSAKAGPTAVAPPAPSRVAPSASKPAPPSEPAAPAESAALLDDAKADVQADAAAPVLTTSADLAKDPTSESVTRPQGLRPDAFGTLQSLPGAVDPQASRDFAARQSDRSPVVSGGDTLNKSTANEGVPAGEDENGRAFLTRNVDAVGAAQRTEFIEFPPVGTSPPASSPTPRPIPESAAPARDEARPAVPAQLRWRVWQDGRVDRSVTGGASWEEVALDPGVTILGGAAPGPEICWLVGRDGVVLRTLDGGRSFSRVDVQEAPDLTAIQATDELRAVVTASDGRTYSTVDGGASWRPGAQ